MDASEALDLSKENIQPLVHGRKTDKLTTALQVNSNFQLQQELKRHREEFELKIRLFNGDDPLQIRFEYVQWLEQSYPNLGPETNIVPFLEETLAQFKNIEEYKQDPRYVNLVIKYIETQPNPLEIYNLVFSENIGTKLAMFYKAWADKLDTYGDIKQANHVFQLGLNAEAQPLKELEAAQMNFQLSVGRRFLMGASSEEQLSPSTQDERVPQREVLGKLKKVTPGMTRLKMGDAGRVSQHVDSKKPLQNTSTGLNVYMDPCEDENNYLKEPSLQNSHFKIKATTMHKENTEAPGVWTKKKTKKFANPIPIHPSTPSFSIHMDEGCDEQTVPSSSVQMSSALKVKKNVEDSAHHATGLFESAPTGKEGYMFCKNKIFLGKSELQVEEFRGAKYRMEKYGSSSLPSAHKSQIPRHVQEGEVMSSQQKKKDSKEDDIPVCIPDPVDNTKVPMYRKQQIYIGGNKEVQLEELRAAQYRNKPKSNPALWTEEIPVCVPCYSEKSKCMYPKPQIYIGGNKEVQLEELRAAQYRNKPKSNPALWTEEIPVCIPCYSEKTICMYPKPQIYIGNNKEIQLEEVRAAQYKARKLAARKSQAITPARSSSTAPSFAIYSDDMEDQASSKPCQQMKSFAIYSGDIVEQASSEPCQITENSQPGKSFAIYSDEMEEQASSEPGQITENSQPGKSFSIYSDEMEEQDPSGTRQPGKVPSFAVYTDESPKIPTKTSSVVYSDDNSQDSNLQPAVRSQSKVLTFSTSDDESLEKKNKSSGSAEKLGLFDSFEKDVPYNIELEEMLDETHKDVYNMFEDMWNSPSVEKTKSAQTVREEPVPEPRMAPPPAETKLDVSDFTVNTKEALQLVQDWWSSPCSNRTAPSSEPAQRPNDDVTFKKPVSIKKRPPVPFTTPFKIFSEETESTPVPPKTPSFEIFTDELDSDSMSHVAPAPPKTPSYVPLKTPAFEIFTEEELADPESDIVIAPPRTPKFPIFCDDNASVPISAAKALKTPKFEIYTEEEDDDDGEIAAGQLSFNARPRGCGTKTPSFNVFCDEPVEPKQSQKKPSVPLNNDDSENVMPNAYNHASQPRRLEILEEDELATPLGDEDIMEPRSCQKLSLPYVAPAMDLNRQPLGHEFKENCPPGDQAKSHKRSLENQRVLNGYLVPSSVPLHIAEDDEYEDEITDMTCNTRAFNFALPSSSTSTPFCMRQSTGYGAGNYEVNGSFLQDPTPAGLNMSYKTQCETLSVILEASKEKSSSSSGSSGYSGISGAPSSYFNSCEKKPIMRPIYEDNASSGLEESVASLHMDKIDPFDKKVIDDLLSQKVQFPLARHRVGYECFFSELQSLKVNSHTNLGNTEYSILKELGKGAYARVLMGKTANDAKVALKQQKPACVWEWYISKEIENRLKPASSALAHFVLPHHIYVFKNSSVLAAPWAKFGNLLDLVNLYKSKKGKSLNMQACLKLGLEMTQAVHALHKINIIHGDIKPDNFVICNFMRSGQATLQLIDYGRSIDMTLFPAGTTFNKVVTTDGFQCTEMKEGREWTYHTDVYGLASSMCCTLLGKYMNTVKRENKWSLADTIPRYLRRDLMEQIFETLLNLPLNYEISILESIMFKLEQALRLSIAHSDEGLQCVDEILTQIKL